MKATEKNSHIAPKPMTNMTTTAMKITPMLT